MLWKSAKIKILLKKNLIQTLRHNEEIVAIEVKSWHMFTTHAFYFPCINSIRYWNLTRFCFDRSEFCPTSGLTPTAVNATFMLSIGNYLFEWTSWARIFPINDNNRTQCPVESVDKCAYLFVEFAVIYVLSKKTKLPSYFGEGNLEKHFPYFERLLKAQCPENIDDFVSYRILWSRSVKNHQSFLSTPDSLTSTQPIPFGAQFRKMHHQSS